MFWLGLRLLVLGWICQTSTRSLSKTPKRSAWPSCISFVGGWGVAKEPPTLTFFIQKIMFRLATYWKGWLQLENQRNLVLVSRWPRKISKYAARAICLVLPQVVISPSS